jgi:hypothetical protein
MRVCLLDPSGKSLKHLKPGNAEDLVARGIAERHSDAVIVLKSGDSATDALTQNEDRPGEWVTRRSGGFTGKQLQH